MSKLSSSSAHPSTHGQNRSSKRPSKLWWLAGLVTLSLCVIAQMPISWIVQKYASDLPYIQWTSGNLWQGSASWQLSSMQSMSTNSVTMSGNQGQSKSNVSVNPLSGKLSWQWKPWELFMGRFTNKVEIYSGQSRLSGDVRLGLSSWELRNFSGRVHPETLSNLVDWELPETPISVNNLSLTKHKETGFKSADGQLTWTGGELGYPNSGKVYRIALPSMRAEIGTKKPSRNAQNNMANNQQSSQTGNQSDAGAMILHVHLVDQQGKNLGDFYLDNANMLDVNLTQRLLEHMPEYSGSAPLDTAVISIRQPLLPAQSQ